MFTAWLSCRRREVWSPKPGRVLGTCSVGGGGLLKAQGGPSDRRSRARFMHRPVPRGLRTGVCKEDGKQGSPAGKVLALSGRPQPGAPPGVHWWPTPMAWRGPAASVHLGGVGVKEMSAVSVSKCLQDPGGWAKSAFALSKVFTRRRLSPWGKVTLPVGGTRRWAGSYQTITWAI